MMVDNNSYKCCTNFTYSYDTTQVHDHRKMRMKQCLIPFVETSD